MNYLASQTKVTETKSADGQCK